MMTTADTYITVECNLQKYYTKNKKGEKIKTKSKENREATLIPE